ncbi:MAG: insulinase family protein [Candidatus Eremiobacteraeota bacterium]|nr:insulinase family protein [Candidatus Eremiobacteraeota bacterium]MBC5826517.1 insulinase family protein [Candidatus Eremiobacteraeota bacterium]
MRCARSRVAAACGPAFAALVLLGAAPPANPAPFAPSTQERLANGAVIAVQNTAGIPPLIGATMFLPAGLALQRAEDAGIAALTASVVLSTPVDGGKSVTQVADMLGASASYLLDARDTRYYIESRPSDFSRLLHDLSTAMERPDPNQLDSARRTVSDAGVAAAKSPAATAFAMVRQARYRGNGYAYPEAGDGFSLARLGPTDVAAFASACRHGVGAVLALEGAVTPAISQAAALELSRLQAGVPPAAPASIAITRPQEVISHRDVASPWVALAYAAPTQSSNDFAAMLVIQALLGRGGSGDALAFGSNTALADDYSGAFYQFDAEPGVFTFFLNTQSPSVDQGLRNFLGGIARLRTRDLSSALVQRAKRVAIGDYYTSITTLQEASWLLGRSAQSRTGVAAEGDLAARISAVTPGDVRRAAHRYFVAATTALVLPVEGDRHL